MTPSREVSWDPEARRVLDHPGGTLRVLGSPGTGKTTLVVHTVAERMLRAGVPPEQVLVLTASRQAAVSLRERIVEELSARGASPTVRDPLVRSVHSYAFAVLRLHAQRHELPPPRLLSGPEQDVVIRELLAGELEPGLPAGGDGNYDPDSHSRAARYWPARLRPALRLPGFAAELRDLLLRAAERGLGPEDLIALGRAHQRPEWVAAGRFFRTYEQVMLLRGSVGTAGPQASAPALDAAELVAQAVLVLDTDPGLLRAERDRIRHLIVDDAQHLDPQQARLVCLVGAAAAELLIFGDPDQTIFSFRGADPVLLRAGQSPPPVAQATDAEVRLRTDHRMAPAVRAAVSRLAARLPGPRPDPPRPPDDPHRPSSIDLGESADLDESAGMGEVRVEVFGSAAAEAAWIADQFRRAHLLHGVPWARMAVLVRSTGRALPALRRALLAAGVPVTVPPHELPLARHGAVLPLLAALRCAVDPVRLDEDMATTLLTSPLGGADPLTLRRLRRELRRQELAAGGARTSGALLVDLLRAARPDPSGVSDGLDEPTVAAVRRLAGLLARAARTAHVGGTAEQVLWELWQGSDLAQRWADTALRGGPPGDRADRDLDAVVALFDAAARYGDRLPGAGCGPPGVLGFCDHVAAQRIPGDSLAPHSPQGDAVAVLTAHAAAGREWEIVAIPGVQEGSWPDLRLRGSLLGVEQLVDTLAGIDPATASRSAPLLAEERRLLLVAASRARCRLLVSAVRGDDEQPSRFLDELAEPTEFTPPTGFTEFGARPGSPAAHPGSRPLAARTRGLSLPELVAELRRVCCDPAQAPDRRQAAAAGLARLARARVPGAHPDTWYGLAPPSTEIALRPAGELARVSPSVVELVAKCPLRWLLTRHGGADARALPAVAGTLVHGLVQAVAAGATDQQIDAALAASWAGVDAGAPWYSRSEQARVRQMVATFRRWLTETRGELTEVACEQDVDIELPPRGDQPAVVLRGRVDRLERDHLGRPVVVDIKTGKSVLAARAVAEHAQLASYQLAAAYGAFGKQGLSDEPGGARVVQLSASSEVAVERRQPPLDPAALAHWLDVVRRVGTRIAGPVFEAVDSGDCARCPARTACPLHESGRQVTE